MNVPSTGPSISQFSDSKFGIIEGDGKDMKPEAAFPYVQDKLSVAQDALLTLQTSIGQHQPTAGGNTFKINKEFDDLFDNMRDVRRGFAAIKQAIPKLDSSEDLNAATKGVEEFETRLTQISGQVGKIAEQWLQTDPYDESIKEKIDMVKGCQKDLMRVHTQILYSKEIKQVRIENLKDTIENTSSRTDSIILRWITKLPFVKAVLRKLFGWGATSPSIQQLEQHFKRSKESLEALKLASFDLHDKEGLGKLIESVQTAQNNLNEFSNYMNNIEGDVNKITEFKGLIEEAKGEVDALESKLLKFDEDFYSHSFVTRMKSIREDAEGSSSSSQAKSAASIISLCEQALDQGGGDEFLTEVIDLVSWAKKVLEKSLEQKDPSNSAIEHSTEDHLLLSMCLQGSNEILSEFYESEPLKEDSSRSIEQPTTNIPEPINEEELASVERDIQTLIAETRNTMNQIESTDDPQLETISKKVKKNLKEYEKYKDSKQYQNLNNLMDDIRKLRNDLQQQR